jgi:hypothetical protein
VNVSSFAVAANWTCAVCGAVHEATPLDWGFDAPAYWDQPRDAAEGFLNSDLCVVRRNDGQSDHFIRGVIEIPIIDGEGEGEESFGIGAWVSLSEPNFKWYVDHPEADDSDQGDPWFGWLSNSVPVYPETLNLKTTVCLRGELWRPRIQVQPSDHPLGLDQRDGITISRAHDLSAHWHHAASK